ncbi:hypothetical protein LIA77_03866 [Sarocladium implicatum]|nr:hypothetical protein LIA77_03866 [Sarocladium implicatum]
MTIFLLALLGLPLSAMVMASSDSFRYEKQLRSATPGIGIQLHYDYGSVAIKQHGRYPDSVARVQGGQDYQTFMRKIKAPEGDLDHPVLNDNTFCNLYRSLTPKILQESTGWCPVILTLEDIDVRAVQELLAKLKNAAEGRLGHYSCFANISVPRASAVREYSRRVIEKAADNVGLRLTHGGLTSISGMALRHYDVNDLLDEVRILVIDSSASGLSLTLLSAEDGVLNTLRSSLNITVPSVNMSRRPSTFPGLDDKTCRFAEQSVREALMNIIASTQESENNFVGVRDWELVVHGDRTYDEYLLSELLDIFPLRIIQGALDPDAPALGAAHVAFWRFNDVSQYDGVPTLCCWRSWGKGCPSHSMRIDF